MTVLAISRDWGALPSIVRMDVSDSLATITTAGYLTTSAIAASIFALNAGAFTFLPSDVVLIYYNDPTAPVAAFFTVDFVNQTFVALATVPGSLSNTLPSGDIFVGNGGNVATGVAMSGDATIANTGALTIANGAITSAKTSPLLIQYAKVAMTAAQWNGMYAAPFLLVAAPGANKLIVVKQVALAMTFVSAAYAAGGVVGLQYDSTVHGAGAAASSTEAAADFFAAASTTFELNGGMSTGAPFTTSVNKGLYISNLTGAFTTGDGTWNINVWYSVIATP